MSDNLLEFNTLVAKGAAPAMKAAIKKTKKVFAKAGTPDGEGNVNGGAIWNDLEDFILSDDSDREAWVASDKAFNKTIKAEIEESKDKIAKNLILIEDEERKKHEEDSKVTEADRIMNEKIKEAERIMREAIEAAKRGMATTKAASEKVKGDADVQINLLKNVNSDLSRTIKTSKKTYANVLPVYEVYSEIVDSPEVLMWGPRLPMSNVREKFQMTTEAQVKEKVVTSVKGYHIISALETAGVQWHPDHEKEGGAPPFTLHDVYKWNKEKQVALIIGLLRIDFGVQYELGRTAARQAKRRSLSIERTSEKLPKRAKFE